MGVDIYGRNPQIVNEKPAIDWDTATEKDKEIYFEKLNGWEEDNPGYYFRANWWSWRPIHAIVDVACERAKVKVNTSKWGENSGAGPRSQNKCNEIADAMEKYIAEEATFLKDDADRFYLCLGGWVTQEGIFLDNDKEEILNEEYVYGQILQNPVVMDDGTIVESSHGCCYGHIKEFITFLRNCGGFRIF